MRFLRRNDALRDRLAALEEHLRTEHPALLEAVPLFRRFDRVLVRMGLLGADESLATRISWWPIISVLGTFSAGKSTFINQYLGARLQRSGNQAVDEKFTVVCYGADSEYRVLPGTALDADPRFPFYRMSDEIEKVAAGEGKQIDSYLQLKTTSRPAAKGKILIDSPGFDADDQRRSTLRLTDHIVDLSDLVLIFFDARHPEPGAMQDTLQHLVLKAVKRADSSKFLYILNQIDTTAKEDNLEEVFGAWQRTIAQAGLVSGKFYGIYDGAAAVPIEDPGRRARYQAKCDIDLAEIRGRIEEVEVGRSYRIIGMLDALAKELEGEIVPALQRLLQRWRRRVVFGDTLWAVLLVGLAAVTAYLLGSEALGQAWDWLMLSHWRIGAAVGAAAALFLAGHFWVRSYFARQMMAKVPERIGQMGLDARRAFRSNTRFYRRLRRKDPVGWGNGAKRRLIDIRDDANRLVQTLNDRYTDPAGRRVADPVAAPPPLQQDVAPPEIAAAAPPDRVGP